MQWPNNNQHLDASLKILGFYAALVISYVF